MSKMKQLGLMFAVAAMMGGGTTTGRRDVNTDDIDITPKQPPIPKGCKEYFFNQQGEFSTERMLRSECVFKCIALNDKAAIKKFNKWNN